MRNLICISMVGWVLSACSGSDAPNFGPETEPTAGQRSAITSTSQDLALLARADVQGQQAGSAAISFAFIAQGLLADGTTARSLPELSGAARAMALTDCGVVGPNSVVWNHCTDSNGYTIDGTLSWSPGHVDVDLHVTSTQSLAFTYSFTGSMTTSATAIDGDMTVAYSITSGGTTYSESIRSQIDVQLINGCISNGTLTVTETGSGPGTRSGAVQVIWTGCNAFRVRNA